MPNIRDTGPSWLTSSAGDYSFRHPISIDGVTGTSSGTVDITISVPTTWDEFWSNISDTTNGYDIVVTDNDGITVLTYDLQGFNYANKTLTLEIDAYALTASTKMHCLWVYWGRSSAPNRSTVFAIGAAINGYIYLGRPARGLVVQARKVPVGATTPDQIVFKDPGETIHVWWDVTDALTRRGSAYNDGLGFEGIIYATHSSDPASLTSSDAQTRFALVDGRLYVRGQSSSGASATDSTITLTLVTTEGRTLVYKAGVDIQTVAV